MTANNSFCLCGGTFVSDSFFVKITATSVTNLEIVFDAWSENIVAI